MTHIVDCMTHIIAYPNYIGIGLLLLVALACAIWSYRDINGKRK